MSDRIFKRDNINARWYPGPYFEKTIQYSHYNNVHRVYLSVVACRAAPAWLAVVLLIENLLSKWQSCHGSNNRMENLLVNATIMSFVTPPPLETIVHPCTALGRCPRLAAMASSPQATRSGLMAIRDVFGSSRPIDLRSHCLSFWAYMGELAKKFIYKQMCKMLWDWYIPACIVDKNQTLNLFEAPRCLPSFYLTIHRIKQSAAV